MEADEQDFLSGTVLPQMTASELVAQLQATPYRPGGNDFAGCDCWGLVEIWYRELFGIHLADRANHPNGPRGLALGFTARSDWLRVYEPHDHASPSCGQLGSMRATVGSSGTAAFCTPMKRRDAFTSLSRRASSGTE